MLEQEIIKLFEKEVLNPLGDPEIFYREAFKLETPKTIREIISKMSTKWFRTLFKKEPKAFDRWREAVSRLREEYLGTVKSYRRL